MVIFDDITSYDQYKALQSAVKRLNATVDTTLIQGGLEDYVEFRIMRSFFKRRLLYKVDDVVGEEIKDAIIKAIREEAARLGIEVLTIDRIKPS